MPPLTPVEFVRRWAASERNEKAASQEHFITLCQLLGEPTPNEADPTGAFYAFEKGASKTSGGNGFADVWLKDHFGWEYKSHHKDLRAAYKQLLDYHEALGNPPLLVVCDLDRFEVHTKWTSLESWTYAFRNADIATDEPVAVTTAAGKARGAAQLNAREVLAALFQDPERLKPGRTTEQITAEAAALFGQISDELRKWQVDALRIARFLTRVLFCMFATAPLQEAGVLERCTVASGDAVAGVPGGGDCYLVKRVLMMESDATAITILRHCAAALPTDGRVLIIEMLVPPGNTASVGKDFDLRMLVQRERGAGIRTEAEFRALCAQAGLRLARVIPTASPNSILEVVPA